MKVLKIERNEKVDRGCSFAEENGKQGLIDSVKTNIFDSGM